MGTKSTWVRVEGQATGVGDASNKETVSLTVPHRGLLRRVRCLDDGTGTGSPTVAAQINETGPAGTGTDIVLSFALTTNPGVDSEEQIFYQVSEAGTAERVGTLYVTVWTNNAATDHVVDVALDIEVLH